MGCCWLRLQLGALLCGESSRLTFSGLTGVARALCGYRRPMGAWQSSCRTFLRRRGSLCRPDCASMPRSPAAAAAAAVCGLFLTPTHCSYAHPTLCCPSALS